MFSYVCVCLSTGLGSHLTITYDALDLTVLEAHPRPETCRIQAQSPQDMRSGDPLTLLVTSGGHYCRPVEGITVSAFGRYATYWNAFLLQINVLMYPETVLICLSLSFRMRICMSSIALWTHTNQSMF